MNHACDSAGFGMANYARGAREEGFDGRGLRGYGEGIFPYGGGRAGARFSAAGVGVELGG